MFEQQLQLDFGDDAKAYSGSDFLDKAIEIAASNADKPNRKSYSIFGAFLDWRDNCTNYRKEFDGIYKSGIDFEEKFELRYDLMLRICGEWVEWALDNDIPMSTVLSASKSFMNFELSKLFAEDAQVN